MEDESTGPSAKQKNAGETDKEDGASDEDDDFNPTLAAMETEIKPKVLKTVNTLTKEYTCLLYTSPSPRDRQKSRMPSSA